MLNKAKSILLNICFFLNILLIFFLIFEEKLQRVPLILELTGRTHPLFLHFPIALLVIVLLAELAFHKSKLAGTDELINLILSIAAFSASITALAGLMLFHSGNYENGETMQWHKWAGIGVAMLAGLLPWLKKKTKTFYRLLAIFTVCITVIAGHHGASITHGEGFLTAPLMELFKKKGSLDDAIVFTDLIQPILQEKCTGCHNPNKAKGNLMLISEESIKKGGDFGPVLIPGNADSSLLFAVLMLPLDDDYHMPPEGKPQLDPEELKILHWWISSGADFTVAYQKETTPDTIASIIEQRYGPGSPLDQLDLAYADPAEIASLNSHGRTVRQISIGKPYIEVYLGNRKDLKIQELEELKKIGAQIISIDLANSSVTDDYLLQLKHFPNLQKLHLENTRITNNGIATLRNFRFLEYLNISNTPLTKEIFADLENLPMLKKLFLYGNIISEADINSWSTRKKLLEIGYTPDLQDSVFSARLAAPTVEIDSLLFSGSATVSMRYRMKSVKLHYTTNGMEPGEDDPYYEEPFTIDSSSVLKIRAIRDGWESSPIIEFTLLKSRYAFSGARLNPPPDERFPGRLDTTLIDLRLGSQAHGDGNYIGYEGKDLNLMLDLGENQEISGLALSYLINHGAYIVSPGKVEIRGGRNQQAMARLASVYIGDKYFESGAQKKSELIKFARQPLRYIELSIKNQGNLPAWHPAKGSKSWFFIDELVAF